MVENNRNYDKEGSIQFRFTEVEIRRALHLKNDRQSEHARLRQKTGKPCHLLCSEGDRKSVV